LLSVCIGQEPASLFLYGDRSSAANSILQAIYDGPLDYVAYQPQPVILEKLPSLADGDAALQPVEVQPGELILDATGNWVTLQAGVSYRPSGCTSASCALTYEGDQVVSMDELVVQFRLLPGLLWSDGQPLTAGDSVYSYQVYRSLFASLAPDRLRYTRTYQALDAQTVRWTGIPGYQGRYDLFFFTPLPEHAWGGLAPADLASAEISSRAPIGWGPYVLTEWIRRDHITLARNENYFRAGAGLPNFDYLVFRFTPDPQSALDALLVGECDYVDWTAGLDANFAELIELQQADRLKLTIQTGTAWELLSFGIQPYDPNRPAFFAQAEVRQAVAYCLDRQALAEIAWGGFASVPDSFVSAQHLAADPEIEAYQPDLEQAATLLSAAGWLDLDLDPQTARTASGVPGVPDGTRFAFTFLVPDDGERPQVAEAIQADLQRCGLQARIELLPWDQVLAPGPGGPVFGRQYDLAQFAWASGLEPACGLYLSAEIPGPYPQYARGWGGANAAGFSLADYDQSCQQARITLPDQAGQQQASWQTQRLFVQELPALPLYERLRVAAMRPDLCGLAGEMVFENPLSRLESLDYGAGCRP
ncbi:MAG: peptide ABC transporter substrate-binding protein, partial [Anaerolineales bacterium]|nr:peptide ABC transporter substrate-binding protein [Anaerolineales bacterium]